jgi:hypothetical protein
MTDLAARIAETTAELRAWVEQSGNWLSPDNRVHPETAAEILGVSVATLRNQRSYGTPLPFYRAGARGRVSYRLADLAAHIERARCDC